MVHPVEIGAIQSVSHVAPVQATTPHLAASQTGSERLHQPHGAAVTGIAGAAAAQMDVVSISAQALNGLYGEDLTVAFNAASPPAAATAPPMTPVVPISEVQTIAASGAGDPALLTDLMNALGGPHYVAALMASQQAGTPTEPLSPMVIPMAKPSASASGAG